MTSDTVLLKPQFVVLQGHKKIHKRVVMCQQKRVIWFFLLSRFNE